MLIADGNSFMTDFIVTPTIKLNSQISTKSSILITPTPTLIVKYNNSSSIGLSIFLGLLIIFILILVGKWLYKKFITKK